MYKHDNPVRGFFPNYTSESPTLYEIRTNDLQQRHSEQDVATLKTHESQQTSSQPTKFILFPQHLSLKSQKLNKYSKKP